MFARFLIFSLILLSSWNGAVLDAQTLDERLTDLSARLDDANRLAQEGGGLSMEELSRLASELEVVLREMRAVERNFSGEREAIEAEFYAESEELMQMIGFITTFEMQAAPDYILHPQGALASVHANIIVDSLMGALEAQVAELAQDLKTWRALEASEAELHGAAIEAFDHVNALRADIVAQERNHPPERATDEPAVLDALYAVSTNLNDFVDGLDQLGMHGEALAPFSMEAHKGDLFFPVAGAPERYRQGIRIKTNDSFVRSPMPGTVRFQANFMDYGNMVIIEPEPDYLVVIAGMDMVAVEEGDLIKEGDVIGFFDHDEGENEDSSSAPLLLPAKALYVETRHKTVPANTMDYFKPLENEE